MIFTGQSGVWSDRYMSSMYKRLYMRFTVCCKLHAAVFRQSGNLPIDCAILLFSRDDSQAILPTAIVLIQHPLDPNCANMEIADFES